MITIGRLGVLTPNSNEAIRKIALNEGTIWIPPIQKQRK